MPRSDLTNGRRSEAERIVDHALAAVRAKTRIVAALSLAVELAAGLGAFLLTVVALDHAASGGLALATRRALLGAAASIAAAVAVVRGVLPALRQISDAYVARVIERRFPELRNALVTAVQLRHVPEAHPGVVSGVAEQVARELRRLALAESVSWRPVRRAAIGLACATAVFGLYSLAAPKPVLPSVLRALGGERPPPTRTQIRVVAPADDASVATGEEVAFEVELSGRSPDEAFVEFTVDGGQSWIDGERLALLPTDDTRRRPQLRRAVRNGRDSHADREYRVVAGDARTPLRRLTVRPVPDARDLVLDLEFPAYTRLGASRRPAGDIDVPIGTHVRLTAATNTPARDARVVFRGADGDTPRLLTVTGPDDTRLEGEWVVDRDAEFFIRFRDRYQTPSREGVRMRQTARPDRPPEIRMTPPDGVIALEHGRPFALEAEISDDYGLTEVRLAFRSRLRRGQIDLWAPDALATEIALRRELHAADFGVEGGEEIECAVEAVDNRHNLAGRPDYQKTVGPMFRLRWPAPARKLEPAERREPPQPPPPAAQPEANDRDESQPPGADPASQPHAEPDEPGETDRPPQGADEPPAELPADAAAGPPARDEPPRDATQPTDDPESEAADEQLRRFIDEHKGEIRALEERLGDEQPTRTQEDTESADESTARQPRRTNSGTENPRAGDEDNAGADRDDQSPARRAEKAEGQKQQRPGNRNDRSEASVKKDARGAGAEKGRDDQKRNGNAGGKGKDGRSEERSGGAQSGSDAGRSANDDQAGGESQSSDRPASDPGTAGRTGAAGDGPGDRTGTEPGEAGGPTDGPKSRGGGGSSPTDEDRAGQPPRGRRGRPTPPPPPGREADGGFIEEGESGDRLVDVGRIERAVNELERRLRLGEVDEKLLADLGWTRARAAAFAREFRRLARAQRQSTDRRVARDARFRDEPAGTGDDVRHGRFGDPAIGDARGVVTRDEAGGTPLVDPPPEDVPVEYRELLEEYYRSMNRAQRGRR